MPTVAHSVNVDIERWRAVDSPDGDTTSGSFDESFGT
jgi:hypothetical protein